MTALGREEMSTQEELAARLWAETPAYMVAMGANDELLEADLEVEAQWRS